MFRRLALFAAFGALILTASSCAEEAPKEEEAPAPVAEAPKAEEGPFYELTKDAVTSHPDWTSMNIMLKGAKLGDKKLPEALSKGEKTDPIGTDHYRTIFDKSKFAIYTYKMTGELQKIEIYSAMADQIADAKFKKLLSSGDLKFMRDTFGMEEKAEDNFDTAGKEYIYDAKGFRFAQYNSGGQKFNALLFSKLKK